MTFVYILMFVLGITILGIISLSTWLLLYIIYEFLKGLFEE